MGAGGSSGSVVVALGARGGQAGVGGRVGATMALRAGGLLRALEKGLGRPKGQAPNEMFAKYVQEWERRAAGAAPAEAAALAVTAEDWQYCVESVDRYKVRSTAAGGMPPRI